MKLRAIQRAEPLPKSRVRLIWSDGAASEVDLGPVLARGGVFAFLSDPAAFNAVAVGARGRTLVWRDPEGDEIDLCADALWQLAHKGELEAAPSSVKRLRVDLFSNTQESFEGLLRQHDVEYKRRLPTGIMAAGVPIEILGALQDAAPWGALAWVVVEWLKNKRSRKFIITTKDNRVIHAEGMSVAEIERALEQSKGAAAIDPDKKGRR
jgi:hypothetical protein